MQLWTLKKISNPLFVKPILIGSLLTFSFFTQGLIKNISIKYSEKTKITLNLPKIFSNQQGPNANNIILVNSSIESEDDKAKADIDSQINHVRESFKKKLEIKKSNKVTKINKKISKKFKTIIKEVDLAKDMEQDIKSKKYTQSFEINNNELVKDVKLNIQINKENYALNWKKDFEKVSSQILAGLENKKIDQKTEIVNIIEPKLKNDKSQLVTAVPAINDISKTDTINQLSSGVEKLAENTIDKEMDDEISFFDYSKTESTNSNVARANQDKGKDLSSTVMSVIAREKEKLNNVATQNSKFVINEKSNIAQIEKQKTVVVKSDYSNVGEYSELNKFNLKIKTFQMDFGKGESGYLSNFDLRPNYQESEVLSDMVEGEIHLEGKLNNNFGTLSGSIIKAEYVPLKVDLIIEEGETEYDLPLILERNFTQFLEKNNLIGKGATVLLHLAEEIKGIDFDKKYEKIFFLNQKMNVVNEIKDAEYVLVIGMESGNSLMEATDLNGKKVSKVINLEEDKINFDVIELEVINQLIVSLKENRLLSDKERDLVIDEKEIVHFNTNTSGKLVGNMSNRYEFLNYINFKNEKNYFEFDHLKEPVFASKNASSEAITLPNEEYVAQIFKNLNLNDFDNQCLVQINLSKKIKNVQSELIGASGPSSITTSYYDNDGTFNEDITDYTSKIYITGDSQGMISSKLEYLDGSVDYVKTFCSIGSYLIEQY